MVKVWFTSDLHFGHKHILYFKKGRCEKFNINLNDPDAIEIHDKCLIEQWNNTIGKKDVIYILGDLSFLKKDETKKLLEKLHGKKHLILGNHDKSCKGLENYFESVSQLKTVNFQKHEFQFLDENFIVEMCHFPILSWNRRQHGVCHVHGHAHGGCDEVNTLSKELRVDVGYDSNLSNFNFIDLETLYKYFKSITGDMTFREYIDKKMIEDGCRL